MLPDGTVATLEYAPDPATSAMLEEQFLRTPGIMWLKGERTMVWILWEETGQYSDYSMGILGVFPTAEDAKSAWAKWFSQDPVSRYSRQPRHLGAWQEDHDFYFCEADDGHYDKLSYVIAPYYLGTIKASPQALYELKESDTN